MNMSSSDLIKKSWERSKKNGADFITAKDAILQDYELKQCLQRKEDFLKDIRPTIEHLANWLKPYQAVAAISDPAGVIIDSAGDSKFLKDTEKIHLQNGACWSEQIRGTNSAGTVSIEGKALAVVGAEHYLEPHHMLYCLGSPIFDPHGELLAVLNISGYSGMYQPELLGLVDSIARKFENKLVLRQPDPQLVISLRPENGHHQQALLSLDKHGYLTGANREARHLINVKKFASGKTPIGDLLTNTEQLLQGAAAGPVIHFLKNNNEKKRILASTIIDTRPKNFSFSKTRKKPAKQNGTARWSFSDLYGEDKAWMAALQIAKQAAATEYPIAVMGESGTGKEMVCQAIHNASARADKPFVALNCGGISKNLMESELFGYEHGAFTGAKQSGHAGVFERANGGTLFLDEIAELPMEIQIVLLRVLQDFTVTRIGGTKAIETNVRIITATHTDLWEKVQDGSFRADLFYRLQGIHITLPPLRVRLDRHALANRLLEDIQAEFTGNKLSLASCAQRIIETYAWPGNVRQLLSALRQAAFLSPTGLIEFHCFPAYIRTSLTQIEQQAESPLEKLEKDAIVQAMQQTEGNISQSARLLGIGRTTLYRKLKKIEYPF